jgi:hypothetical protein
MGEATTFSEDYVARRLERGVNDAALATLDAPLDHYSRDAPRHRLPRRLARGCGRRRARRARSRDPVHADLDGTPTERGRVTLCDGQAVNAGTGRVLERRRGGLPGAPLPRVRGLSIREIADRLGRSPATVKAYFYDPFHANKRPTDDPQEPQFWALPGHARTSICKWLLGSRSTARGRRSRLPDLAGCGSLERRQSGPRYCP